MKKASVFIAMVIATVSLFYFANSSVASNATDPTGLNLINQASSPFAHNVAPDFFVGNLQGESGPQVYCKRVSGGSYTLIGSMTVNGSEAQLNSVKAGQILELLTTGSGNTIRWKVVTDGGQTEYSTDFEIQQ